MSLAYHLNELNDYDDTELFWWIECNSLFYFWQRIEIKSSGDALWKNGVMDQNYPWKKVSHWIQSSTRKSSSEITANVFHRLRQNLRSFSVRATIKLKYRVKLFINDRRCDVKVWIIVGRLKYLHNILKLEAQGDFR